MARIVKDMALTRADFFRGLPVAMGEEPYEVEGDRVTTGEGARQLSISIRPLPPRRLGGLLALDHCEVVLTFTGWDAAAQAAFLKTFDRAYQRGGG